MDQPAFTELKLLNRAQQGEQHGFKEVRVPLSAPYCRSRRY